MLTDRQTNRQTIHILLGAGKYNHHEKIDATDILRTKKKITIAALLHRADNVMLDDVAMCCVYSIKLE